MCAPLRRIATSLAGSAAAAALVSTLVVGSLVAAGPAAAQSLTLLSFNVEHLMSAERFARWQAFCQPLGWREAHASPRSEAITYCDALDGTDGRGRRLFAPVHDPIAWRQKTDALAALVRQADADLVLLQEVSDTAAARLVLGADYEVVGSDAMWRSHVIAQNLAIGWRKSRFARPPQAEVLAAVSQAGADGRVTRPGLALTVDLDGGRQLSVLNLHLKAGCRQGRMNEATSRSPERAFRRQADCAVLQRQVPAIEDWADAKLRAGHAVIIAGDFNRDLLREIRDRMPARADGSSPAKPAAPATIASLVAELSDEDPPAAWFTLARAKRYPRLAECHRHIDGFLLSRNLEAWLTIPLRQLATEVLAFIEPVSIERVRPSDHCPHLLHLPFEVTDRRR